MKAIHVKLAIAIVLDLADFFIGRIPGWGTAFDFVLALVGFAMFGWKGFAQLWEVVDFTDQIDGFVPTLTLIALAELREERKAAGKSAAKSGGKRK
ncbi:hypothetical protein FF098_004185 [Parvularcula flava]|uniref:Uncharacterized protein n=1 Tax=Aquisalinus luteolus TaxID=1566827 RepID=A0A8J3EQK9_9PROT|nr:hypothetical protein [Aquisalinus luteolus]NHK27103.1 hypothetical protein [Aquisalinus luteolus]GGH94383.1 hypothetical protein GCM10011355_08440 [Aquisalinus luteolus]